MPSGVVAKWVAEKGFGFLRPNDGGEDIFCHVADVLGGESSIREGDEVKFSIAHDERKGKPRASDVESMNGGGKRRSRSRGRRNDSRSRGRGRREESRRDRRDDSRSRKGGDRGGGGREETGKISNWNESGGFGFIQCDNGGDDLFCHVSQLLDGDGSVRDGDYVKFAREFNDRKGKDQAIKVTRAGGGGRRSSRESRSPPRRRDDRRDDSRDSRRGRR